VVRTTSFMTCVANPPIAGLISVWVTIIDLKP
jgi:hypothetical protein